ncbi:ORF MSV189 putative core protein, Amsacta moorei EPV entomopoxvirus G1L homolog (vaccinia I7L), similar to SW:P29817 [Melanoplus sanguinipes entomopoxvirus]|uniref:ORF MSV189 putative core protein, Amsacta moorei EPV entomopoxvirus G1L homolog (Vaccinia I7L), similar to SW:P29817 n=1 Tax=Melanoplus sanguinipes entomopoxvirus TaxID=83191 RepID=Q9YVQ3_MSEPV|nr:ORF MSV189 putative core protein, Amsacta moorei EPV entomopoxvirus G1L homolog (vaccinia I7L), similar to SW:P29817 [Melanoplus sanguinipes entomopoxvirus]AAC97767.1 ORF MSV189 putative core protein, Amsacta moorei EPV entomopoxvirus G1L homolog (vaccinia I7L), similar to SW:P29817 [Melanoplus sanguinipes entomopoxvirus 'O']
MQTTIRRFFNKNLKMPESGINYILMMLLDKFKIIHFINPIDYSTNANTPLINHFDKSETKGKISYIPLEFLLDFYKSQYGDLSINFKSEFEMKEYLINMLYIYLSEKDIKINDFLKSSKYKNIPLIYFRKPFIKCEFSKTKDFSMYASIQDDYSRENNVHIGFNNIHKIYPKANHGKDTWLHVFDIYNVVYPLTFINNDYEYYKLLHFPVTDSSRAMVYSGCKFSKNQFMHHYSQFLKNNNKQFFIFPMIYNDHFTSAVIDKKRKICYLFNSSGYSPEQIKHNKKYMFIDTDMNIKRYNIQNEKTSYLYHNIDILRHIFGDTINIFIMNSFEIQYDSPDCGMFTILFLYNIILNNLKCEMDFKKAYLYMTFVGDLIASSYRGIFFISKYDVKKFDEYNTLNIIKMKNKKYEQSIDMYCKNMNRINKAVDKLNEKYNEFKNLNR